MLSRKLIDNIIATIGCGAVILLFLSLSSANADPNSHSHEHQAAHSKYHRHYLGIMRPDKPTQSCCNNQDCQPADTRYDAETKRWTANKYGRWVDIPPEKIVPSDKVPDELGAEAHLCAPPYSWNAYHKDEVFCLILPSGGT